ncbi:cyclic nucleotide-binding-like protein [Blastocladiella britannica]|nr:cyclic nucleotide-binding-like protein [Blastocladiella britannica]
MAARALLYFTPDPPLAPVPHNQRGIDLSIPGLVDPISRLAKTLALTVLFSHVNSCMFWVLSIRIPEEDRWIDKFHILEDRQGLVRSVYARYLRNVSSAEKALFFLPREVENDAEILYQFFEMLCAAVLYGSIFGNMSSIVRALDSQAGLDKASKLRKFKKANLEGYMKKFKFPPELQTKVLQQEEFDWAHKKGVDTDDLFMNLPLTIREQVNYHMYYDLISSVPIFKEHANEVIKRALCQKISIINITPNFYICKAGERGTEMYFVRDGDVEVMPPDESKVFVTLGPGAFFGEVALFSNNLRTATVKSKTEVQLVRFHSFSPFPPFPKPAHKPLYM